jgi:hypothetical protein
MPLILLLTLLLIIWIRYADRHVKKQSKQTSEEFWQREQQANFARRTDISSLPYISVPEELPRLLKEAAQSISSDLSEDTPGELPDTAELLELQADLSDLSQSSILNLTGLSNTDLKLRYGAANLDTLTRCDENFTRLCRVLNRAGCLLAKHHKEPEAIRLLSYAVSCGSDVQSSYLLLAQLYRKAGNMDGLHQLSESVSQFDSLRQDSLKAELETYCLMPDAEASHNSE